MNYELAFWALYAVGFICTGIVLGVDASEEVTVWQKIKCGFYAFALAAFWPLTVLAYTAHEVRQFVRDR